VLYCCAYTLSYWQINAELRITDHFYIWGMNTILGDLDLDLGETLTLVCRMEAAEEDLVPALRNLNHADVVSFSDISGDEFCETTPLLASPLL